MDELQTEIVDLIKKTIKRGKIKKAHMKDIADILLEISASIVMKYFDYFPAYDRDICNDEWDEWLRKQVQIEIDLINNNLLEIQDI